MLGLYRAKPRAAVKESRKQSATDIAQIRLARVSSVFDPGSSGNQQVPASHNPIIPSITIRAQQRPLPEVNYADGNENSTPPNSTYFSDGKRPVDFVLAYSEPHDEYLITASPEKESALRRQFYLDQLRKAQLNLEYYRHHEQTGRVLVFIKIHVPSAVLCREAERLRMRLPLILEDEAVDDNEIDKKCSWWKFFCGSSNGRVGGTDDPPSFGGRTLTWTFDRQSMHMFKIEHPNTFFTWRHRTEIVYNILQECRNDKRHDRRHGVETLLEKGLFDAAFPVHDGSYSYSNLYTYSTPSDLTTRQRLHADWAGWASTFKPQPLNRIRNYFGEKVGFYFAFMDFYTKMLIFPSAFGLMAFVYGLISTETTHKEAIESMCDQNPGKTGSFLMCPICNPPNCAPVYLYHDCELSQWQFRLDNEATLMVACATLGWCALFVKFWKRREAQLAVDWDTYETKEEASEHRPPVNMRAAYEEHAAATKRSNPVTMEPEYYVPRHSRILRVMASISVATLLLIAAGGSLMGLIVSRIALYGAYRRLGEPFASGNVEWSRWTVHGFIFCMVVIFEWIYDNIADRLTELECPKTNKQFLSSLLWKLFIFEELLDFLPIAYAAWFRGKGVTPRDLTFHSEICDPNGCMSEVIELVAVLLLCRLIIGNIAEVACPFFKTFIKATFRRLIAWWSNRGEDAKAAQFPQWLKDYHLNQLKLDGVAEEYMEMMIQFSFVAFFVPALPLAPLLCLINNVAEIRVDGINFLASHRRPVPERAHGLQIWNKFMGIILKVAVLCNAALIAFTSEIVPQMYFKYAVPSANTTELGYKAFSMSKMLVADWPQLHDYLKDHPMPDPRLHGASESHHGGEEDISDNLHLSEEILNNHSSSSSPYSANMTHHYCYYLDFRRDEAPYGYKPTWWKIFCLRVAAFASFTTIFYTLLFLCDFAIGDVPQSVINRLKRREYIIRHKWNTKTRQRDEDNVVRVAQFIQAMPSGAYQAKASSVFGTSAQGAQGFDCSGCTHL